MADKITLTDLANLENQTTAVAAINANNAVIESAFNNTLSLDGTQPNQMGASLDMNSNRILNLPAPSSSSEPVRSLDLQNAILGTLTGPVNIQNATDSTSPTTGAIVTSGGAGVGKSVNIGGNITVGGNSVVTGTAVSTMPAATLKGNPTNASHASTDFTIQGLTARGAPDASNDKIPIYDNAAGTIKYVTPGLIAVAATAGVTTIAGNAGAFTLGTGLKNATNSLLIDPAYELGRLSGMSISVSGGSASFTVNSGVACDSLGLALMLMPSPITKSTSAWTVGSSVGGLDTGSIGANAWYHVFVIKRLDTGVVDVLISSSATAPTLPTNYTVFRRIGSVKTDVSSNWIAYIQHGDEFWWVTPVLDVNVSISTTTNIAVTLGSVPTGVAVKALMDVAFSSANLNANFTLRETATVDALPMYTVANTVIETTSTQQGNVASLNSVWTNTSAGMACRSSAASSFLKIVTRGWKDLRV